MRGAFLGFKKIGNVTVTGKLLVIQEFLEAAFVSPLDVIFVTINVKR